MMEGNQPSGQAAEIKASQLLNKQVMSKDGQKLGTIKAIRREGSEDFAVIDHGGALSFAQQEIMVPAERLAVNKKGSITLMGLTQQDFEAIPQMQPWFRPGGQGEPDGEGLAAAAVTEHILEGGAPVRPFFCAYMTLPIEKPVARYLRAKMMSTMPGIRLMTLAAESSAMSPDSTPAARVMMPAMGLASIVVSALASMYSIHENMKQKKAATAMPGAICGMRMRARKEEGCGHRSWHFRPSRGGWRR